MNHVDLKRAGQRPIAQHEAVEFAMNPERRNLYRILHVQPEAPAEIIKASYRTLMSSLRMHPDLGGDARQAALINTAYEVLGDAARRREYDRSRAAAAPRLARAASAAPPAAPSDPAHWLADRCCPFCTIAFTAIPRDEARCTRCHSPLMPAPAGERASGDAQGRRRGERFAREQDARLHLPGQAAVLSARLQDLSFTGLSLLCAPALARGSALRVVTPGFDTLALVVACRRAGPVYRVHARLLTLQLLRGKQGSFVSAHA